MEGTLKHTQEIRRCLDAGDTAGAGKAAVAAYADASKGVVEALSYLASIREAVPRSLGDEAATVLSSLSPELAQELDGIEEALEAAFAGVDR